MRRTGLAERMVIAGGGTGGHLFPGLAVAKEMKVLGWEEVHFVGTSKGIEARVLPKEGYPLHTITAEGFRGKGMRSAVALFKLVVGYFQSLRLLRGLRPQWVLGVGGYASLPGGLAAISLGIPLFLHEQNVICGLANRLLAPFAREVFLSYPGTKGLPKRARVLVTGNPVRRELLEAYGEPGFFGLSSGRKVVLVFGGSQGAKRINEAIMEDMALFSSHKNELAFIHQTGEGNDTDVREAYVQAGLEAYVAPFVYEMGRAYATAHLVVCRAGATTLAEVTALGKPSLLIPFPHAVGSHQLRNAKALEERGAGVVITEDKLTPGVLGERILNLIGNEEVLEDMGRKAREMGRPQAARDIAMRCQEVVGAGR